MVDLVLLQSVSTIAGAIGVLVGAIYYIYTLRYNMKAREMEICRLHTSDYVSDQGLQRYAIVMTMDWKDHEDFMKKYGYSNPEMFGKWVSQFMVYETMGYLIKHKLAKAETIHDLAGFGSIRAWEKYKDIIQSRRGIVWGQDYMSNFEFLAEKMLKIKMTHDASFKDKLETYRKTGKL